MKRSKNSDQQLTLFENSLEVSNSPDLNQRIENQDHFDKNSCQVISFREFKQKKEEDLKMKFYSLSDHLD